MNTETLSLRLQTVVKHIPEGFRIADIGSDHAYLPCHVVHKGIVPYAVAGEVVEGPFQSALKQVKAEGLEAKISVVMGDGLDVIKPGDVDCITICGMGGTLIASILERGKDKLVSIKRLILQPNVGAKAIRLWLIENGWKLVAEEIMEEDGKIYEVLVAERGNPMEVYDSDVDSGLLMGPYLIKAQNEAFRQKWLGEMANWHRIVAQLELADNSLQNSNKKKELLQKIKMVEEAIQSNEES